MRTKRYFSLLLAALLLLALAACGAKDNKNKDKNGDMTIQPAQLSEEEERLAELLALDMGAYHIFDFQAGSAKFVELNVYELVDGEWSHLPGGGGVGLSEGKGRIALAFGKMTEGVRLAIQADGANYSTSVQVQPGDDVSGMAFGTAMLDASPAEVKLEQEVPLVLQVATSKNELRMYKVDYFGMPRELAKSGYEHIYAITVTFSAQEPGGPQPAPSADEPSAEPSPAE